MTLVETILNTESITNVFTVVDVLIVLVLSTVLCAIAAKVYQLTHDGMSYSHNFVQTIVMFGVVVSNIMLIIGSNIARAFTLVGALSIIRFRNAIKETKDVGFIFFMMVIGMAVGTRFYSLAVLMTIYISALLLVMHIFKFGKSGTNEEILKIIISENCNSYDNIEAVLAKKVSSFQLINIEKSKKDEDKELVYLVKFKLNCDKDALIKSLKRFNENKPIYLFGTDHLVY
jgi:uncharacterized membrane protein YhiD involved in acid resistance